MAKLRLVATVSMLTTALVYCSGSGDVAPWGPDTTASGTTGSGGSSGKSGTGTGAGGSALTLGAGAGSPAADAASNGSGGANASAANAGGASGTSTSGSSSGSGPCKPFACDGVHTYQCADCLDNDKDGKIDAADPDCLGPCHNREDGFDIAIPGANNAPCKEDCYFDQDSGSGNDDCYWDHRCDPKQPVLPKCPYNAAMLGSGSCPAVQSATCHKICGPLTPNGCDCFGCCDIPGGSGNYVFIGSLDGNGNPTCKLGLEKDPSKCHPCTPVADCLNSCDKCELCLGKNVLPPECFPNMSSSSATGAGGASASGTAASAAASSGTGGATGQCPMGIQPCGLPNQPSCPVGEYCITGCCVVPPPL